MREEMKIAQKKIEELTDGQIQLRHLKQDQEEQEARRKEAIEANRLAMEQQVQSLKDSMEKQMLAKIKESEEMYNKKLKEMEAGQYNLQKEMEGKLKSQSKKAAVTDRLQLSLQIGRLQRAEERRKGKRKSVGKL